LKEGAWLLPSHFLSLMYKKKDKKLRL